MTYYIGKAPEDILGEKPRYFYGLRRTDEGELYFARIDQLMGQDALTINLPGPIEDNFEEFEVGVDFFEGRDVYHNLVFGNLNYEQFRWDDRAIYYYLNDEGELVARINQGYTYPAAKDV